MPLICLFSCNSQETAPTTVSIPNLPLTFQKVLDAHGGLDHWRSMQQLEYTMGDSADAETHFIDLQRRRTRIETASYQLGFDGEDVWVSPNLAAFPGKSPRFVHNLHFYFVALPFVLTDPGVKLEDIGSTTANGQAYERIKATFGEGIGDAPDDQYILYIDPQTFQIDFIIYSVTYFDASRATQYNALDYDWVETDGILTPKAYTGYRWTEEGFGEQRYARAFSTAKYSGTLTDESLFSKPSNAEIDTTGR